MKTIHGILSVILSTTSLYLMFIRAKTDQDIIYGFIVLLTAIIFICFMMMEEQKEEITRLRNKILGSIKSKPYTE